MSADLRKLAAAAASVSSICLTTACGISLQSLSPIAHDDAQTYSVTMRFTDVSLLPVGGEVRIGQAVIGYVSELEVDNAVASARTQLRTDVELKTGTTARIELSTPISDAFIEITPGTDSSAETLVEGDTLDTDHTSRGPDVEKLLLSIGSLVGGAGLGQLGTILHETDAALNGRGELTRGLLVRLNSALSVTAAHHDSIGRAIDKLGEFAATTTQQNTDLQQRLASIDDGLTLVSDQRGSLAELVPRIERLSASTRAVLDTSEGELVDITSHLGPIADQLTAFRDDVEGLDQRLGRTAELLSDASPGDYLNTDLNADLEQIVGGPVDDLLPPAPPTQEAPR
ncbi:MCE-family lipoprotein LprK (MCE-family lipoprotein Mce1e) [Rhodococcus sp. B7740]|uniref:MCE family protein n=1 Tax=Rhodococcus sp. B7740 TaxID=1564114 RepID=UPI0005D7462A|nr:MCE family protein [Rhodococcus sp. B7740]AJW40232.1 MCE-family lipoprotein LprK (MCE-family lipoprotein Mce1e) [Rhodococcus sp. B7740]